MPNRINHLRITFSLSDNYNYPINLCTAVPGCLRTFSVAIVSLLVGLPTLWHVFLDWRVQREALTTSLEFDGVA